MTVGETSPQRADVVCKTPPKESANKKGEMVVTDHWSVNLSSPLSDLPHDLEYDPVADVPES